MVYILKATGLHIFLIFIYQKYAPKILMWTGAVCKLSEQPGSIAKRFLSKGFWRGTPRGTSRLQTLLWLSRRLASSQFQH